MKLRISLAVILAIAIFSISGTAFAMTSTELQTLIAQLQTQIAQLQAQLVQMQEETTVSSDTTSSDSSSSSSWCYTFNNNLVITSKGNDVKNLHIALEKQGFTVSAEEKTESYFGTSTRAAAKGFQEKYPAEILSPYGLKFGNGGVGLKTREKLNALYGCNKAACSEGNWIHALVPVTCPSTRQQSKLWTKIGTCTGGVSHPETETVTCTPQSNVCNYFMYSDWSTCNQSKIQTRTVTFSSPSGCQGGNPITTRACDLVTTPTCTSFIYSGWSACNQLENQTSGTQTRTIVKSLPNGCEGGNPVLSQVCVSTVACTNNNWKFELSPTLCPATNQQTKTWTKAGTCTGGITHPATEIVSCVQPTPTPANWCYTFVNHLLIGNSGTDVKNLHIALEKEGYTIPYQEKTQFYFGVYTKVAVIKFQEKYASEILAIFKLQQGTGRVGITTVAKLNKLYGCAGQAQTTCTPNWQCDIEWGSCANGQQTKNCIDTNYCGVATNRPATVKSCSTNVVCPMDVKLCPNGSYVGRGGPNCDFFPCPEVVPCDTNWSCSEWNVCLKGQQVRTCRDINQCGTTTDKPETMKSCSSVCTPDWYCGLWSSCSNAQKTRTCTDENNCGVLTNKPDEQSSCVSSEEPKVTCQNVVVPKLNLSCVYGIAPYNTASNIEMEHTQMDSFIQAVGNYTPEESCGCSWLTLEDSHQRVTCPTTAGCDFTKVPEYLPRRTINDYCGSTTEVNPVEWSSRLAKGEPYDQALQNTIENQKRIGLMNAEKQCIGKKVNEYYIGGQYGSPNWMCEGQRYRLNPLVSYTQWQKWVNGAWTTNFGWNASFTCQ